MLRSQHCSFSGLCFDPFEYLNNSDDKVYGFIYKNYSPANSSRMYFTAENRARIDFFRAKIEEGKTNFLINEDEYHYLLACLIESVSDVSNTAGVYGAFLKKWDARALKPIVFHQVDSKPKQCQNLSTFNAMNVISAYNNI